VNEGAAQPVYSEEDLLPLSGLQHLAFCERQCALIHIEGVWEENRLTTMGSLQHVPSDKPRSERREGVVVSRGMALRSLRLGVVGKADVVEFHPSGTPVFSSVGERSEATTPLPVEHKRGRPKPDHCDEVQVCAEAMCLEEMLNAHVPRGAIFYGEPRRRLDVQFERGLRCETERLAARFHEMVAAGITPEANYSQHKCRSCSLLDTCLPKRRSTPRSARWYLASMINEALATQSQTDGPK
jgi:CRISPR-associated exonuclease Cas4